MKQISIMLFILVGLLTACGAPSSTEYDDTIHEASRDVVYRFLKTQLPEATSNDFRWDDQIITHEANDNIYTYWVTGNVRVYAYGTSMNYPYELIIELDEDASAWSVVDFKMDY